jgi:hypothetical protein
MAKRKIRRKRPRLKYKILSYILSSWFLCSLFVLYFIWFNNFQATTSSSADISTVISTNVIPNKNIASGSEKGSKNTNMSVNRGEIAYQQHLFQSKKLVMPYNSSNGTTGTVTPIANFHTISNSGTYASDAVKVTNNTIDADVYNTEIYVPSHNPKFHHKKKLSKELQSYITIQYNNNDKNKSVKAAAAKGEKLTKEKFSFTVQKDISSFLDYSIIGMPKTGTTSIMRLLSNYTLPLDNSERCDLVVGDVPLLVNDLIELQQQQQYDSHTQQQKQKLKGIKCPQDITTLKSVQNYAAYFNKTKLVIGIRHPIKWFESFYNFQVRNMNEMVSTDKLNRCVRGSHGVCAWRANISDFLFSLNKTRMNNSTGADTGAGDNTQNHNDPKTFLDEQKQYMNINKIINDRINDNVGQVFIYVIDQLEDEKTQHIFVKDLFQFLGIHIDDHHDHHRQDNQSMTPNVPHISTAGVLDYIPGIKEMTSEKMIDICDAKHDKIRRVLMKKSINSSIWIRKYFLNSQDVHVSSREFFEAKLEEWMNDPCSTKS